MREVEVDPMALAFARVMTILTVVGIILMVIPAIFYFAGQGQYIPLETATRYWQDPTLKFWREVKGIEVHGYEWIFENLEYSDCQSMLGVLLLMLTPLFSIIAASFRTPSNIYRILLIVALVEFVVSVFVKGG